MANSKKRKVKRAKCLEAARKSLALIFPDRNLDYVCPLCLTVCRPSELTLEHAPPKSIGGKEVCLTCERCNGDAGRSIDTEPAKELEQASFLKQEEERYRATWQVSGEELLVEVSRGKSGLHIEVLKDVNDPKKLKRVQEDAFRRISAGESFELSWGPPTSRRAADISFLKAAYVAAFAKLGYRYILRKQLELVRRQIQNPGEPLIETMRLYDPSAEPTFRRLLLLDEPVECVGVQIGTAIICLPFAGSAEVLYEVLHRERHRNKSLPIHGNASMTWPTVCEFAMDGI